jgi:hypothetical protein
MWYEGNFSLDNTTCCGGEEFSLTLIFSLFGRSTRLSVCHQLQVFLSDEVVTRYTLGGQTALRYQRPNAPLGDAQPFRGLCRGQQNAHRRDIIPENVPAGEQNSLI